jgi:hypothetical protein
VIESKRILAVDPGGATGFAFWEGSPLRIENELLMQWQELDDDGLTTARTVEQEINKGLDILVCESFSLNAGTMKKSTAGSLQTIQTIGMLRWLAFVHAVPFVLQTPAAAASFSSDDKLRRLGWWKVGEEHARSATRHLILYLAQQGLIDVKRLMP